MDITANQLKTMKAKQLRRIIRESINEVLTENTAIVTTKTGTKSIPFKDPKELDTLRKDSNVSSIETTGGQKLKEQDIEELARLAKGFRLADPNIDATQFTKRVSGVALSDIINFFRENPGAEKAQMQAQFGFVRPQIANAVVNGLLDAGVLVKLGAGGEVEIPPAPGEEQPEVIDGPESMFIGSAENPLAQYFDDEPNIGGEEDFNAEEEPTIGVEEPGIERPTTAKEKAADFTLNPANDRLIGSLINNYAAMKAKGRKGGGGDEGGLSSSDMRAAAASSKASAEASFPEQLKKLVNNIKQEDPEVQKAILDSLAFKFSSVNYPSIAKAIAKALNLDVKSAEIEPIEEPEDEEDTLDEAFDAEYQKRKLQFYAGIIK